jgi:lipid-A-disaccharide synthase
MEQAGATLRYRMEGLAAFGIVEIVTKIRAHYRLLRSLRDDFRNGRYDLVILVDYPGFHIRVAEAARAAGTKVLYYIAPQLWAWRPGRARRLAAAVDRLAVVLPFEQTFFGGLGLRSEYVGHPLVDGKIWPTREQSRAQLGITNGSRVLGIFPGSRTQEIRRLWQPFRDAALQLLKEGSCDRIFVAGTETGVYPAPGPIEIVRGNPLPLFAAADAALAKSGTTTLEAALAGTPMVVAYKVHPVSWAIFQRVRTVRWVSLVNLVAGREIVPEILQERAVAPELAAALRPLLNSGDPRTRAQQEGLALVRERLGQAGAANRVVELAGELLGP